MKLMISRPLTMPDIWSVFTDGLKIPPSMSREVWRALSCSRYSASQAICYEVWVVEQRPLSMRKFQRLVTKILPPKRLCEELEALVSQRLLRRAVATQVEECVWQWVDKNGDWQMIVQLALDTLIAGHTLPATKEIVP